MIALLGLAQIPLGLTLYGSPLALFVLYALAVFALLVIYFILSHIRDRRIGIDYDSQYSHSTGSVVEEGHLRRTDGRRRSGRGKVVKGAIAGAGLYALVDRYRNRRSQNRSERPEVVASRAGSHRHSGSYVGDERDYGREGGWEDRLLRIAEAIGLGGLVWRMLDRKHRDRDSDVGDYGPSLAGATEINQGRIGGGRPPPGGPIPFNQPLPGNQHPLNQPLSPGQRPLSHPASELSHSSFLSASGEPRRGNGLRDGIATLGFFELVRRIFNRRQGRNEDQHLQEEQNAQVQGRHLTGDGRPLRQHRPGLSSISSDTTSLTGASHPQHVNNIPPVPAGIYPEGAGGAAVTANERNRSRNEELPLGGVPRSGQLAMPPIPPDTQGIFHANSSGSEVYIGDDGRNHWRHRDAAAGGIAGGAAGVGAAEAAGASSGRRNRRDRRQSVTGGENNMASPPVSVKVKLHDGGRHVTLRRLSEAEAAAERKARQLSRERTGRNKGDSVSSLSGTSGGQERFRRNQFQERQQAEAMRIESERLAAARTRAQNQNSPLNVPQPAPIPESSSSLRPPVTASVGSPGTYDGNTTDGGASADYANNRRRRRAERAQAKQVREARGGKTVEFE